jgi:hypothetical protein
VPERRERGLGKLVPVPWQGEKGGCMTWCGVSVPGAGTRIETGTWRGTVDGPRRRGRLPYRQGGGEAGGFVYRAEPGQRRSLMKIKSVCAISILSSDFYSTPR